MNNVVIVGGGITGLSAAWALSQRGDARITVIEGSDRWGGKIFTEQVDGFTIEAGPDAFLTQKTWALDLAREIGLADRLLNTNDHQRAVFVLKHGRLIAMPDGVHLIVPTRMMPFVRSPLISLLGKLRMGMDWLIQPRRGGEDESVAEFITRRLGSEALEYLAEPLMSGVYSAEAEQQSILATFPRYRDIEAKHGSLIRGMLAAPKLPPNQKTSAFTSLIGGTGELVDRLVQCLSENPMIRLISGAAVDELARHGRGYRVAAGDRVFEADSVILTTPSYITSRLIEPFAPEAAAGLARIRFVSTGTVSFAYRRDEIAHPLNGFGVVIPRREQRPINALTWTSTKLDHRAPSGYALIRVFFGGSRRPDMMAKSDDEIVQIARSELAALMGIHAEPIFHRLYRWHNANPQYEVGHLGRIDAIEAALPAGLYVAGCSYRGVGIPDCVHQGQIAAAKAATSYL